MAATATAIAAGGVFFSASASPSSPAGRFCALPPLPASSFPYSAVPLRAAAPPRRRLVIPFTIGGSGDRADFYGSSGGGGQGEGEGEGDSSDGKDSTAGDSGDGGDFDGNGGEGGGDSSDGKGDGNNNRNEAFLALAYLGRSLQSLPVDLAAAIDGGRVPGHVVYRFAELEKSWLFRWLLQFGGFKERLLADDLFLAKVAMECGVGIFTKSAAEYEKRKDKFFKELDFVVADVIMAIIADFMLVWLPAPTVALGPPIAASSSAIAKFFHGCPDNAFQVALAGTSYSFLQRVGAILRNGSKLFVVGTSASLIGTAVTNGLIVARQKFSKDVVAETAIETQDVPILSTSAAYGLYMAVSSNLRYQILAGIIEQRMLEPLFHKNKLVLSTLCFAFRTGNTFLGSLLWVDYARFVGVQ